MIKNPSQKELLKKIKSLEAELQKKISAEKQHEEAIERMEVLLNALPVGIVIIDYNTQKIIDLNPHALMTFGCSLDSLIGKKCREYICPAEKGNCPIIDQKSNLDRSEREIITSDGKRIPVLKTVIKTEIEGNRVLIECFIDISDKKLAEQEYVKREKLQAVLEMAGALCHEFNQPLQVISGYCELLQLDPELNLKRREQIDIILREISKMGSLTRDVMNITKYETKPYLNSMIVDIKQSSSMHHSEDPFTKDIKNSIPSTMHQI